MKPGEFKRKFAIDDKSGSYLYKTDSMMNRWNQEENRGRGVELTRRENWMRYGWIGKGANAIERDIMNRYNDLCDIGCKKEAMDILEDESRVKNDYWDD